jgi:hypothetical protein
MKFWIGWVVLLGCGWVVSVGAQEDAENAPAGKVARTGYRALVLEDLPRDENGQLTPAIWDIIAEEAKANPKGNEARALADREHYQAYYQKFAGWKAPEPVAVAPGKLRNLDETPTEPRFPLTGKVWPSKVGEASVCLWEDDKVAAITLGVDDNCAQDLEYWRSLSAKHGGLRITWNLITFNIDGVVEKGRVASFGTWATWKQMISEGHGVASHSAMHCRNPIPAEGWPGPEWEIVQSKQDMEANLPGQKIRLFVYPGAGVRVFGTPRDPKTGQSTWRPYVAKHYAAARVGGGKAINPANMTDYLAILATTGSVPDLVETKNPKMADQHLGKLLDPDPANKNYRGWANIFIHFINNGKDFDTNPFTVAYGKVLEFYNAHRADLWTGLMQDIALYGQVRDTATLVTDEASASKITFTLTSKMDPDIFDYPLTIKVRLPDSWKGAGATQAGKEVPSRVIQFEGAPYALVKVLADRGAVTLVPN